jgi:superoxide dismutase, Cu-Zn family
MVKAICVMHGPKTHGIVKFSEVRRGESKYTQIEGEIRGLAPNSLHGFHIHEYGDLSDGCKSAGAHFNPKGMTHGDIHDKIRHVGDLGNIKADGKGIGKFLLWDKVVKLSGTNNVIGRSLVIHEKEDDLGRTSHPDSKTTGDSGARIACGVIGIAK